MRWAGGLTLGVAALALVVFGVLAAVLAAGDTYVGLGGHGTYATDRYGLATESTDWRTTWLGWAGSVRLRVAPEDGKPIFVGVASPAAMGRYLSGAGYATIADDGRRRTDHAGAAPPARPVDWTARAEGAGTQTLRWSAAEGRQIAFAMNADRSRPVRVRVESSAITLGRMPWWVPAAADRATTWSMRRRSGSPGGSRADGPTIVAMLDDGPLAGRRLEAAVVEGRPPKTLDVEAEDGGKCRYCLAEWAQAGPSAVYTFLYRV